MRGLVRLLVLPFWLLSLPAGAEILVVNADGTGDYPTIQAAIDASQSGDIIELADGTFAGPGNVNLGFCGKTLAFRSRSDNPDACVIDCSVGPADSTIRAFNLTGSGKCSLIRGITIAYGHSGAC
jgi:pectin methylesterase-like acyl-CoA thioesterase